MTVEKTRRTVQQSKEMSVEHNANLVGAAAQMRPTDMTSLGLHEGSPLRLKHEQSKATVVVVVQPAEPFEGKIIVSESTWAKLAAAKDREGKVKVSACRLSRSEQLRRITDLKHLAPVLAIVAALLTVLAVVTGQAIAAGINPLKVLAAGSVCLSAICAAWVAWKAAGR